MIRDTITLTVRPRAIINTCVSAGAERVTDDGQTRETDDGQTRIID